MNKLEQAWQDLADALPPRLFARVAMVFPHKYWDEVEITFYPVNGKAKTVKIPKDYWLDDRSIARICLEAP